MVELITALDVNIAMPTLYHFTDGNTTLAELESTPKDFDLVGGASSPCT